MNRGLALAAKLLGSSVIAQAAVLLATAFAASRTTPAEFAKYGVVTTAAAVIATFNTGAAEARMAVVPPHVSRELMRAGTTATLISGLLCAIGGFLGQRMGMANWTTYGLMTALGGAMTGLQQLLYAEVLRHLRQGLLARGRVVQGVSNALLIVLFVFLGMPGYFALTAAWAISLAFGNAVLIAGVPAILRDMRPASARDWRTLGREVRWQPFSNFLIGIAGGLPMMVMPAVGAAALAGHWALVNRILYPIVSTMQATFQPIYYGHAAQLQRTGRRRSLRSYFAMWRTRMMLLTVVAVIGFWIIMQFVFPLIGHSWVVPTAVVITGLVYFGSFFMTLPLSQTLVLLGRVDTQMRWTFWRSIVCVLPWVLIKQIGAGTALATWAAMSALTFIWQLDLHRRALDQNMRMPFSDESISPEPFTAEAV